jgi:GAF domain-containing protein
MLEKVARLGIEAVPGAEMAGLTLAAIPGGPKTVVATNAVAPELDDMQYATGDGPCLTAYRETRVVRADIEDLKRAWPAVAATAEANGVVGSLSVPIVSVENTVGALNFYTTQRGSFTEESEIVALAFATQASAILVNAHAYWGAVELAEQLGEAMRSRATIEQAKGILISSEGCTADEAFDILRRASQRQNVKLRDIAEQLVARARRNHAKPSPPRGASHDR